MDSNQVCNLRECSCSDGHCADIVSRIADDLITDSPNRRARERLQVLEAWKLDADEAELALIAEYEGLLRDSLTSYWDEKAKDRREEFAEEDARARGEA